MNNSGKSEQDRLDFSPLGFKDVANVGHYKYTHAHKPLVQHSHGNMIQIILLESGYQNYIVEGQEYSLSGGDVIVFYPHEKHGSGQSPEEIAELYWLSLHVPGPKQRFLSLPPGEGKLIVSQLQMFPRHFKGTTKLRNTLKSIFPVFNDDGDPLRVINLQNMLLRFLLDLLACHATQKDLGPSPEILKAQRFIDKHLFEHISLTEVAKIANLSLSRFKMKFKKQIGIPPAQYIARNKIEKSQKMLASGRYSITEVAMKLDFSSSQYFATVFKRYDGNPPSDYLPKMS